MEKITKDNKIVQENPLNTIVILKRIIRQGQKSSSNQLIIQLAYTIKQVLVDAKSTI